MHALITPPFRGHIADGLLALAAARVIEARQPSPNTSFSHTRHTHAGHAPHNFSSAEVGQRRLSLFAGISADYASKFPAQLASASRGFDMMPQPVLLMTDASAIVR